MYPFFEKMGGDFKPNRFENEGFRPKRLENEGFRFRVNCDSGVNKEKQVTFQENQQQQ